MRSLLYQQQQQISEMIQKLVIIIIILNRNLILIYFLMKCKDASMDQFIDKIDVSIKSFNHMTKDKHGVTDIIMDNMNRLSIYERPLHCTDKKRETLYIKTDEWECDKIKNKINDAIKKIEAKQLKNIKLVDQHLII